jgi:hypothetical protein
MYKHGGHTPYFVIYIRRDSGLKAIASASAEQSKFMTWKVRTPHPFMLTAN